jgi:hypothetical protein
MSTGTQQQTISYGTAAPKVPLRERVNLRMLGFAAVVLFLIGTPVYVYLDSALSGGVKDLGDRVAVDLKAMSNFPFDQTNGTIQDVPKQWRELDGKRVELVGEIWAPTTSAPEVSKFELVYSIAKCCTSGPPQIQHFVQSTVKDGGVVPFYGGLVTVVGTLKVDVKKDAGRVSQVYALEVESVTPQG